MNKHRRRRAQRREGQVGTRDLPAFLRTLSQRAIRVTKKDRERWSVRPWMSPTYQGPSAGVTEAELREFVRSLQP